MGVTWTAAGEYEDIRYELSGDTGYETEPGRAGAVGRFHVTDLHIQIRRLPKPVVAVVAGYAIGGGHVPHLVCDLTIAGSRSLRGEPRTGLLALSEAAVMARGH